MSRCSRIWRICASGYAPWNSGTGWPLITANTAGIDCTWNAAEICGFASTSTLARIQRPPYSAARASRIGESCLQGPHHSAQRSSTTGTVIDWWMTSASKEASVTSMTTPAGALDLATAARC